jgi:hypothetical protein
MYVKKNLPLVLIILLGAASLWAQVSDHAKILDVRSFSEPGSPIVAPNNGHPVIIATSNDLFILQVLIGDMAYSGQFPVSRHVKPADFIVGDFVSASIVKDKLVVASLGGKQINGKIVRRERVAGNDPSPPSSPAPPAR